MHIPPNKQPVDCPWLLPRRAEASLALPMAMFVLLAGAAGAGIVAAYFWLAADNSHGASLGTGRGARSSGRGAVC